MTYSLFIFDLDGTLIDTAQGIINSCNYAAKKLNANELENKDLIKKIGSPVQNIFMDCYNLDSAKATQAVKIFRDIYAREGIHQARIYDGIKDLLKNLKQYGNNVAVVTMKPQTSANAMLYEFEILSFIDSVYGKGDDADVSKKEMIEKCINRFNVDKKDTVVIGDSVFDIDGARGAGTDFIGVLYGFGFSNTIDIQNIDHISFVDSVNELSDKLLGNEKSS